MYAFSQNFLPTNDMNSLDFQEKPIIDESIEEYEYHEYTPYQGVNLSSGEIRIHIESQDIFTHPCKSYLLIEGQLQKADKSAFADADNNTLTNNAMMYLFREIRYHLSNQEIETITHPGQATTMLGLLKYPDDFSKSKGLNMCWYKDTDATASISDNIGYKIRQNHITKSSDPKGSFSFVVPLSHIFGFCEDYDKVVFGFKHTLSFIRESDTEAIFKDSSADAGKIRLDKISWFMPHVLPADRYKMALYKTIESKAVLPVGYRMRQCETIIVPQTTDFTWRLSVKSSPERPRYIILGFQTDKSGNEKNPAIFDHVKLKNAYVMLNSKRYPVVDYDNNFDKNQISRFYNEAASFRSKFHNVSELVSNPNISPADFKELYPLFVFDVTKQSERLKVGVIDIQIKAQFSENVAANTYAYALVISDRIIQFQSDGNKMSVVL